MLNRWAKFMAALGALLVGVAAVAALFRPPTPPIVVMPQSEIVVHPPAPATSAPPPNAAARPRTTTPTPAAAKSAPASPQGIRVPQRTKYVAPVYPPDALAREQEGWVIVDFRVNEDGHVTEPKIVKSVPAFDAAALDAVSQWEYTPMLVDGKPRSFISTVTVSFNLRRDAPTPTS